MEKTKMNLKHSEKVLTPFEENSITEYASTHKVSFLEAKEYYFEHPEYEPVREIVKVIKHPLTINESKLGVTLVVSKLECEGLGLDMNMACKDALKVLRKKLGL